MVQFLFVFIVWWMIIKTMTTLWVNKRTIDDQSFVIEKYFDEIKHICWKIRIKELKLF